MADETALALDPIERRYGRAAAAEWQVLLNRLEIGEGFALVVLVVPDGAGARLCQNALDSWLVRRGQHLTVIAPDAPTALHDAAATLLGLPADPGRGAIWLAAAAGPWDADAAAWDLAWRHALVGLNQERNPLRRRFALPLILVGTTGLIPAMREIASDLWSVRSLSLRIEPGPEAMQLGEPERLKAAPEPAFPDDAADPDLALRMAERLRGRSGQQHTRASLLDRAGRGFAGRRQWQEAERAWRESAWLYEQSGSQQEAGWIWLEVGDIARVTGRTMAARDCYLKALAIAETLAQAEPDRADYQRDLSVSYERMGDLYRALGQGEAARDAYAKALAIRETLAQAEPDRADYQRDLSVSYNNMGDLYRALGQGEAARDAYAKALAIAETLAQAEPDRADYQRDLSVSYEQNGRPLWRARTGRGSARRLRQGARHPRNPGPGRTRSRRLSARPLGVLQQNGRPLSRARTGRGSARLLLKDLAIAETLAQAEPDRADYQRDLVVSLIRQSASEEGEGARAVLRRALEILEALHSSGRLMPTDNSMLDGVRQMLRATTTTDGKPTEGGRTGRLAWSFRWPLRLRFFRRK